jgi:secreted Zn-dependent insulinase-like peptidase
VDTSDFRNAIVYYLKEIHGIRDETFKYKKINELFEIQSKVYIKKLMCKPQDVTIEDYRNFFNMLYDSEKCHVCILAMETKKQVSMIYVAKALSEYIS